MTVELGSEEKVECLRYYLLSVPSIVIGWAHRSVMTNVSFMLG